MKRWPVRLRLALMHAVLFLVLGLVLLGGNFLMVRSALSPRLERLVAQAGPGSVTLAPEQAPASEVAARIDSITVHTLLTRSGIALAGAALLVGIFSWWIAGRSLRPIRQITAVARDLSERTLYERIELGGPADELRDLADTIDGMLARLDDAFEAQSRFVANASHELRTPLAIARTAVDVYRAKRKPSAQDADIALSKVGDATERSDRLLDSLLMLARAEVPERTEHVDLAAMVASVIDEQGSWTIERSLEPASVVGDPVLLERMVSNLIDNALRYGDGQTVRARVAQGPDSVSIVVENSGTRIDPAHVRDLFKPFVRLHEDRTASGSGSGLGLSIVETIARVHGGSVAARPRDEGGLRMTVTLPTAVRSIG